MARSPKRRARNFYLLGLYVVAVLSGVRTALLPPWTHGTDVALRLGLGLVLAHVVLADARVAGRPLPQSVGWQIWFFWPVAAPGVVIALRKWPGVLYLVGHAALYLLVAAVVALGVRWLVA